MSVRRLRVPPVSEAKSWLSHCFAPVFHAYFGCVFLFIVLGSFSFSSDWYPTFTYSPSVFHVSVELIEPSFWKFQDLWRKQPTKWAVHIFACVSSVSLGPSESIFDSRYLFFGLRNLKRFRRKKDLHLGTR